jgi:ribonuclease D
VQGFDWISRQGDFDQLVDELTDADAYALDTEFHRERTYWPRLALVQVATRNRIALVDPLAVDVVGLKRAFERNATCTMHAGSQDLEILQLICGEVPRRIFDTQVAALFSGYRTSSLGKLVEDLLEVRLDKSAQLTDWTRRPLPDADQRYAASDVVHLLDLRDVLIARLQEQSRLSWAEEEFERLRQRDRSRPDPRTLWWKLRGKSKLTGKARAVAQELAKWREEVAERENRPPRTVLSDVALLSLAQRPARDTAGLRGVRNLDPKRFKHTDGLLSAIRRGLELSAHQQRLPPKKPKNLPQIDGVITLCLAWLSQRAREERIDMSVLGTREDVTELVLHQPSRLTKGWRQTLVGDELQSIIDGRAALRVSGTELELVDRTSP